MKFNFRVCSLKLHDLLYIINWISRASMPKFNILLKGEIFKGFHSARQNSRLLIKLLKKKKKNSNVQNIHVRWRGTVLSDLIYL